jgi:hypothetical protein
MVKAEMNSLNDMKTMASEIRMTVKKFKQHPFDIYRGDCENFAEAVVRLAPGSEIFEISERYAHTVIQHKNRFYDSEEPYGDPK